MKTYTSGAIALVFMLILLTHISCNSKTEMLPKLADENNLVFTSTYQLGGISISGQLSISKGTHQGTVMFAIKNNTKKSITIQSDAITIKSPSGYVNFPSKNSNGVFHIPKSSLKTCTLYFQIINNPILYQRYGLPGDIQDKYFISVDFILNEDGSPAVPGTMQFTIAKELYQKYLEQYGIEHKLTSYEPIINSNLFIAEETEYIIQNNLLKKDHHDDEDKQIEVIPEPQVILSGNELVLDQIICKFSPYKIQDTFYLYVKLINRYPDPIQFDSSQFSIITDSPEQTLNSDKFDFTELKHALSPLNTSTPNHVLVLNQNERADFTIAFQYSEINNPKKIQIIPKGISIYQKELPLIGIPLEYQAVP